MVGQIGDVVGFPEGRELDVLPRQGHGPHVLVRGRVDHAVGAAEHGTRGQDLLRHGPGPLDHAVGIPVGDHRRHIVRDRFRHERRPVIAGEGAHLERPVLLRTCPRVVEEAVAADVQQRAASGPLPVPPGGRAFLVGHLLRRGLHAAVARAFPERSGMSVDIVDLLELSHHAARQGRQFPVDVRAPDHRPVDHGFHAVLLGDVADRFGFRQALRHRFFDHHADAAFRAFPDDLRFPAVFGQDKGEIGFQPVEHIPVVAVRRDAREFGDVFQVPGAGIPRRGLFGDLRSKIGGARQDEARLGQDICRDLVHVHVCEADDDGSCLVSHIKRPPSDVFRGDPQSSAAVTSLPSSAER